MLVNRAIAKLTNINPYFNNVALYNQRKDLGEQEDPELRGLLTNKNGRDSNNSNQTASDDDIDGNDKFKERELKESSSHFLILIHNIDGRNISVCENVNKAPGEGHIALSFSSEPNWEALACLEDYSAGRNCFNEDRKILINTIKICVCQTKMLR